MKFLIYYFLFLFFLLSIFISGVLDSQDSFQYLGVARNIYYKGKPTAPPYDPDKKNNVHMSTYAGKNGQTYSPTGLGFSVAFLPAVAFTDLFYKYYGISPAEFFPLENDWLILMSASFINAFFGALLGMILYIYLKTIGLNHKTALFISFVSIFTTNLFNLSKHTFAHMMFIVFLVLSFLMIKLFSRTLKKVYIVFSGIFFGIMMISYNLTSLLSFPPLLIYYFLLIKPRINLEGVKLFIKHLIYFLIGITPFIISHLWFENLRAWPFTELNYLLSNRMTTPKPIIIEAIFGQLFSPGRSIFIYSPILLEIIFFWFKIKRNIFPELAVFLSYSAIYILFFSLQSTYGGPENGYSSLWHGESSWGPRYLSPLLPFGILIIGHLYQRFNSASKKFFFYPLLIIGLYISLLGIIVPYQIKFHELSKDFWVNNNNFAVYTYSNLITRFSPVIMMSKKLVKNFQSFPKTLDHGEYNVRLYDGINVPFNVGGERWRVIDGKGYISFDNIKDPINKISLGLINHPLSEASQSAAVFKFILNETELKPEVRLNAGNRTLFSLSIDSNILKVKDNVFIVDTKYDDSKVVLDNSQLPALISMSINNKPVNLESLDFPYVSSLGPAMMGVTYNTYGGAIKDPWKFWDLHTQVYERTPDFWWFRSFYYWDMPKKFILILFIVNILLVGYFGYKVLKYKKGVL